MSEISKYLAEIGSKGGKKSRRSLSSDQAKSMVQVREARKAYKRYHSRCFWSFDPNYKILSNDLAWVADRLMTYGGKEGWTLGSKLCP